MAETGRVENAGIVAGLGAAAVIGGALLPWAKVDAGFINRSLTGTDGDGKITIAIGIGALVLALVGMLRQPINKLVAVLVFLGGGAAAVIAAVDLSNVNDNVAHVNNTYDSVRASTGVGLYITLVGGGLLLLGGLLGLGAQSDAATAAGTAGAVPVPPAETHDAEAGE